jgi:ribosomal protein S18 acetylase RimI-like enzyme
LRKELRIPDVKMRRAQHSDRSFICELLTASFDDNNSVNYVVKQDEKRISRIRMLMGYSFDMCNRFGEVWIDDDRRACALILFPDKKKLTLKTIIWDLKLAFSVIGLSRVNTVLRREGMIKKNYPRDAMAYLWFLGVHHQHQGRGAGSALLREVIRECESKNRPVYLETSMQRNIPFYQKFGFEIYASLQLTYTLYLLRRK